MSCPAWGAKILRVNRDIVTELCNQCLVSRACFLVEKETQETTIHFFNTLHSLVSSLSHRVWEAVILQKVRGMFKVFVRQFLPEWVHY